MPSMPRTSEGATTRAPVEAFHTPKPIATIAAAMAHRLILRIQNLPVHGWIGADKRWVAPRPDQSALYFLRGCVSYTGDDQSRKRIPHHFHPSSACEFLG